MGVPYEASGTPPRFWSELEASATVRPLPLLAGTLADEVKFPKHGTAMVCWAPVKVIVEMFGSGGGAVQAAAVGVAVGLAVGLAVGAAVGVGVAAALGAGVGLSGLLALTNPPPVLHAVTARAAPTKAPNPSRLYI